MPSFDVPTIEDFRHEGGYTNWLGGEYQVYQGLGGLRVVLSAAGVQAFNEELPGFSDQVQEVALATAEGPKRLDEELCLPLDPSRWHHKDHSQAPSKVAETVPVSRYNARGWPHTTVESYDFDRLTGWMRFGTMDMLAERLAADRYTPVNAPSQFALFINNQRKHDAALMEQVEGIPLGMANGQLLRQANDYPDITRSLIAANRKMIDDAIKKAVPDRFNRKHLINDVDRSGNILVNDGHYIIVNQPDSSPLSFDRLIHKLIYLREVRLNAELLG